MVASRPRKQTTSENDHINMETAQVGFCHPLSSAIFDQADQADQGTKNVVIFGETGVGKSSLINLIARKRISETSSGALGCTLSYERHQLVLDKQQFAIWDTAGLDEGTHGAVPAEKAEAYLKQLLHELAKSDGIDLLVYCVRGTRVRSALLTNYHIFYSAICRKKVPIAIVITGLENQEDNMETWWYDNQPQFTKLKMFFDGHACVTTLEPSSENVSLEERREASRAAATKLIVSACRTARWKPSERSWVETAYSDIRAMLSPRDGPGTRLPAVIMCEVYRRCRDGRSTGGGKRTVSFQNPISISLSLTPFTLRSPVSFSNDMSRSKLPFDHGVRYASERLYRVYQVSLEGMEEETERVTIIKRAADLLIFCVQMEETVLGTIKSQWEYFNITYGGDLSPQIVVVVGAPDQASAERWWKGAVGDPLTKDDVYVAYLPPESTARGRGEAARQLQSLIDDRCIDYSKVTFTGKEGLFRRSLHLDMSALTFQWVKRESASREDASPAPEQDMLTKLGVWEGAPDQSPTSLSLTSPKKSKIFF